MLTESVDGNGMCVVQVTPVTYEGDGYGNWWDESRVSDLVAMYKNGAFVYQVRPGAYISLHMVNNGEDVKMSVVREEVVKGIGQMSPHLMGDVELRAGEKKYTKKFRMKQSLSVIDVKFYVLSEVVLHLQFEGVAAANGVGPASGGVSCLLAELLTHAN